ncbi:hypothetical protein EJ08DRAFT_655449 [Tothia fuscella]|uniref:Uncharacterized protein n=1 Tax=Tothia fuscella TaxID=1048955 RepID=A0A9P4P355_9PEZI|nr:hypothetical protein EJ08DRAFT_655449 [Tothia fuscella]
MNFYSFLFASLFGLINDAVNTNPVITPNVGFTTDFALPTAIPIVTTYFAPPTTAPIITAISTSTTIVAITSKAATVRVISQSTTILPAATTTTREPLPIVHGPNNENLIDIALYEDQEYRGQKQELLVPFDTCFANDFSFKSITIPPAVDCMLYEQVGCDLSGGGPLTMLHGSTPSLARYYYEYPTRSMKCTVQPLLLKVLVEAYTQEDWKGGEITITMLVGECWNFNLDGGDPYLQDIHLVNAWPKSFRLQTTGTCRVYDRGYCQGNHGGLYHNESDYRHLLKGNPPASIRCWLREECVKDPLACKGLSLKDKVNVGAKTVADGFLGFGLLVALGTALWLLVDCIL